ncbi:MAG: TrmB family transcriptional regulator [Nanoarchaeota archaeon]|nr:TrmB family transcriptional regulator [Nanoarchaeota archaeon]
MIIKQELVSRIKEYFNLNIYETKVWLALLSRGLASAGETAELSGVPRSRTYDVLESLAKRGFAIVKIGKPLKYIAVEPKIVIEKMKTNTMNEAQEKVKTLSELKDTPEYAEIENLYKTGITPIKAEDLSGHFKGRPHIISKIKELFDNAKKEVSICITVSDFESKARILLPLLEKLNKNQIRVKMALSGDEDAVKRLNTKYNLKARRTSNNGRFFIADKRETLFMINPESSDEEIGVWLNSPSFSNTLAGMFEGQIMR